MEKANTFLCRDHSWRYDAVILAISTVFHIALWWFLKSRYSFIYSMSDDMLYRDMVSGVLYGKVTHNIIYQHWFSLLISWLYTSLPMVEWCGMLMIFVNIAASVIIHYSLCKLAKNVPALITANGLYLVFTIAYLRRLVFPTYTEAVALLCAAVILLYFAAEMRGSHDKKIYVSSIVICVFFAALGFSWRSESFLMMAPFALAVWGALFIAGDKKSRIRGGVFAGVVVAVIGGIMLENKIAYSIEPHDQVFDYYDSKVTMTDLYNWTPSYDDYTELYEELGISRESAALLYDRAFPLAEDFKPDSYVKLADYVCENGTLPGFTYLEMVYKRSFSFTNMGLLGYLALGGVVVTLLFLLIGRKKLAIWGMLFHVVAYVIETLYLAFRNRTPDRIVVMAYMILFMISAMYLIYLINEIKKGHVVMTVLSCGILGGLTAIRIPLCLQEMIEVQGIYTAFAERENQIYQYFADHEDNFYLTTSFLWGTGGYVIAEPEGIADNYAFINGYMIMIPEWVDKLEANGIDVSDVFGSFVENENILLLMDRQSVIDVLQIYMDRYYPEKELVKVDEVRGFPVYNVQ